MERGTAKEVAVEVVVVHGEERAVAGLLLGEGRCRDGYPRIRLSRQLRAKGGVAVEVDEAFLGVLPPSNSLVVLHG